MYHLIEMSCSCATLSCSVLALNWGVYFQYRRNSHYSHSVRLSSAAKRSVAMLLFRADVLCVSLSKFNGESSVPLFLFVDERSIHMLHDGIRYLPRLPIAPRGTNNFLLIWFSRRYCPSLWNIIRTT